MNNYLQRIGLFILFITLNSISIFSQSISGVVTEESSKNPIVGASIRVEGTNVGTVTDINGLFKINVPSKSAKLLISYIGFKTKQIYIGNQSNIKVTLEEDATVLNQVVVIGYGTVKKSDLTGSVSSIKAEELTKMPSNNVVQALQGKASGVEVVSNSGAPGGSASIRIRGMGTINNSDPLYVVDGISMDNINYLSSEDIASMEILKDASSAAIYGSRAANGVVLITTKNGKDSKNKISISVSASLGSQEVWKQPDIMDKNEYIYFSDYVLNQYVKTQKNQDGTLSVKNEFQGMLDNGNNWWSLVSRNGFLQKYNLSVSGGDSKINYFLSGNYQKTDGIVKQSGYDKKVLNAKINSNLSSNIILGANISYANEIKNIVNEGTWGIIKTAINYNPLTPVYDISGNYSWSTPIENLRRTSYDALSTTLIGQLTFDWTISKDFKYSSRASYTNYNSNSFGFSIYNTNPEVVGSIRYDISRNPSTTENLAFDNILTFSKSINDHSFSMMVGQTLETSDYNITQARGIGYGGYSQYFNSLNLATISQDVAGYATSWRALSFLGRISYSYKNKYLIQSNFRADGSSRFSEKNRWGYFPSLSLGWKINEESFLKDVKAISLLKLRAGWGQLGNNRIGNNAYLNTVNVDGQYIYGIGIPYLNTAMSITQYGNENIRWERTESTTLGLDLNLFDNRFTSSVDLFKKDTYDMLIAVPIVYSSGFPNTPLQNAGSVQNLGYELQASYRDQVGDLKYEISGNITQIKNKVTSLGKANEPILGGYLSSPNLLGFVNRTMVGVPIACYYGYKTDGILKPSDFASDGTALVPVFKASTKFQPGDMKFVDVNHDGKIDENDQTFLGSPHPDFFYGFNLNLSYKGFDLQMFFQGVAGNKLYNVMKYFQYSLVQYDGSWSPSSNNYSNVAKDYFNKVYRPQPDPNLPAYRDNWGANTTGLVPAPNSDGSRNAYNFKNSDFYIEDGSYLRLKNLQIGYTFANEFCKKLKLKSLRAFASATNVLTLTKYTGMDPEVGKKVGEEGNNLFIGIDEGTYPQVRTYMAGLVFEF